MSCWSTNLWAAAYRCSGPKSSGLDPRNSLSRSSSTTSPAVITSAPTTTATRSSTAAAARTEKVAKHNTVRISKRWTDRKEKLKVADVLKGPWRGVEQQLLIRSLKSVKCRRVDTVCQIHPDR